EKVKAYDKADTVSLDTLSLEQIVQETRAKDISQLESLSKKVYYLHTDLLYYRKEGSKLGTYCYESWKVLIKKFIMAQVRDDQTDMVLKVFRQSEKATIDNIVDAFIKLQRYDILKSLEDPLCNIAQYFNKDDSGYQSNGKSTGHREIVRLKNMTNDLPLALNKNMVIQKKDPEKPKQPMMEPATNKKGPIQNNTPILFLTFAQDGLPTAINIQEYVDSWTDIPEVKVITLNGKRDEIFQNPEKVIREYFEKADFIVPILTPGYLDEIKSHKVNLPNTTENLDHKYANFIYNLIVNHYIHATGCLNMKVRSVLPQNSKTDLFMNITMYPDLMPWTYETSFDEQFQAFLKKESS
ncbi:MyD88, partial [Operophtera brumata]